jgi:glucan-binding YG repeat protein
MKKQTKVLLAAAMLTLGASFTSMAALSNGTWVMNDEGWQYADKDGEFVEEKWCMSNGIEFWINEDEVLGSSEWVADDKYVYYVQSDGSKTVNDWKYLYEMGDDEEEKDQNWYYFDAKGRMVKNAKKDIKGFTYYFDNEGKMITGWVDTTDKKYAKAATTKETVENLVYTNEDGQLMKSTWLNVFPWTKDAEEWYEGEDEKDYYANKDGKIVNGKEKIDELTYFFNNKTGVLMTGWVVKGYGEKDVYTSADAKIGLDSASVKEAYWTDKAGYAKKNSWREAKNPVDEKTYWYHFDKLGKAFLATSTDAVDAQKVTFNDGEDNKLTAAAAIKVESKKINGKEYFFTTDGEMIDGLQIINSERVYLDGGVKQDGKVVLTDENENNYTFLFGEKNDTEANVKKYVAVEGNYKGYYYSKGQLITSEDSDTYKLIDLDKDGKASKGDYIVDYRGKVVHSDGKDYGFGTNLKFDDKTDAIK